MKQKPFWFCEQEPAYNFRQCYRVKEVLYSQRSPYQKIEILHSYDFGKMLLLDGIVQTTEKDEFCYHELLSHVPMFTHPQPKNITIIGGGDGGCLREVIKHKSVENVYLIEIDEQVIEASKRFLNSICQDAFTDPRVKVIINEGSAELAKYQNEFDVILVDSTDPIGEAKKLFTQEFYGSAYNALRSDGIIAVQSGGIFFQSSLVKHTFNTIKAIFNSAFLYLSFVPTYPGCLWSFTLGSKSYSPLAVPIQRIKAQKIKTKYYTAQLHYACFCLPKFVEEFISC